MCMGMGAVCRGMSEARTASDRHRARREDGHIGVQSLRLQLQLLHRCDLKSDRARREDGHVLPLARARACEDHRPARCEDGAVLGDLYVRGRVLCGQLEGKREWLPLPLAVGSSGRNAAPLQGGPGVDGLSGRALLLCLLLLVV